MVSPKGVLTADAELGKFTARFSPGLNNYFRTNYRQKMLLGDGSPQAQCVAHIYNERAFQKPDDGLSVVLYLVFYPRNIEFKIFKD